MKAFQRTPDGSIKEILIDLDRNGNPILPSNTTIDPRPQANEGHYVTVVGDKWVQIPITPPREVTLEELKDDKCDVLAAYKDWLLEQPVYMDDVLYDADSVSRDRLTQAVLLSELGGPVVEVWVDANGIPRPIADHNHIKNLSFLVAGVFQQRFTALTGMRLAIIAATSVEELDAIVIPEIGDDLGLNGKGEEPTPEPDTPEVPEEPVVEEPETPEEEPTPEPEEPVNPEPEVPEEPVVEEPETP